MTTIAHLITTPQVVQELGISHLNILQILHRKPELRPAIQLGKRGDMLWTKEEIARLSESRSQPNRRKRK